MPNNPLPLEKTKDPILGGQERIQAFRGLADSARARFESRRELEWRVALGIWSVFGGGAAVVLSARSWSPMWWDALFGAAFVIVVCYLYGKHWLPYLIETGHRELRQQYYWETHIEQEMRVFLPTNLQPPKRPGEMSWISANDALIDPSAAAQTVSNQPTPDQSPANEQKSATKSASSWHIAIKLQFVAAILFGLLFEGSLVSRAVSSYLATKSPQGISIDGKSISIDAINGLKIGTEKGD